jgi:cytochrome c oxidase assembly protein subunit 11
MAIKTENIKMVGKLAIVTLGMFAFGYALVPIYKAICEATGVNTIEFDANSHGPWEFKPAQRSIQVHPGQLATVMYEFQNVQNRRMAAQAIPSYAPKQAMAHFNKLECFCFSQYTLEPGEKKSWPVAFVIDPKLSKDVTTITLSYTFFEVGGKTPAAPIDKTAAASVPVTVPTVVDLAPKAAEKAPV